MFYRYLILVLILIISSSAAMATAEKPRPQVDLIEDQPTYLRSPAPPMEKAAVDTTYMLGGPDRLDGKFEDAARDPDWHGWTHRDITKPLMNHWHVSTYWADGLNGHGVGNQALVCVDENIPSCDAEDPEGGTGSYWVDDILWGGQVSDPTQPTTVRLTAFVNYDLETDYDFLELFIHRGESTEILGQWSGTADNVALDISTTLQPAELVGPGADEVRLFWRVYTDYTYSDEDCMVRGHGAAQIDDISILFNDELVHFSDFESGNATGWALQELSGVGDFTSLRSNLPDMFSCNVNNSVQAAFIDDGLVVPGAGPTLCKEYCYGLGGFILNNTGGLLANDTTREWNMENEIVSPPIAWTPGLDSGELAFDVYRHNEIGTTAVGTMYFWDICATTSPDPSDLAFRSSMEGSKWVYPGGPDYQREVISVGGLIPSDAQWVQVRLYVIYMGTRWGELTNGTDCTPAPYFDNVSLKAWAASGPELLVSPGLNFVDAFPEQGLADPSDRASHWCRIDNSTDLDSGDLTFLPGDSLVVEISLPRDDTTLSPFTFQAPRLHWVMDCNDMYDDVRPTAPGSNGILRGSTVGTDVWENGYPHKWAFDLPDTGWFFPGDRLRYYITATDFHIYSGDQQTSVWPADTTAVLDFFWDSTYPRHAEVRALPSMAGNNLLYYDDAGNQTNTDEMIRSLNALHVKYDHFRAGSDGSSAHLGMGVSATTASLKYYDVLVFDAGSSRYSVLRYNSPGHEDALIREWLDHGDEGAYGYRAALLMGDNLFSSMSALVPSLLSRMTVASNIRDISLLNGLRRDLRINPVAGNGVLPDDETWIVDACVASRPVDGLIHGLGSTTVATLDPAGQTGGPYPAAVTHVDAVIGNRIGMLPFSYPPILTDPDNPFAGYPVYDGQTMLLRRFLEWFDIDVWENWNSVPDVRAFSFQVGPNPFNPLTTIEFELPRSALVTLDIYDVQGRRVKRLLSETMAAGPHSQAWNGRDGQNRQAPSGVYFYRFTAGDQERRGKLTLLK